VSAGAASATDRHDDGALGRERLLRVASIAFFGVLPVVTLVALFVGTVQDDADAFDFRPFYRAAGAILDGRTPYPANTVPLTAESGQFVYPPLVALVSMPLHVLPLRAADLVVMALLVAAAAAAPFVLGVRDWRCYGVLYLWPPVLAAIQTGNVTLWFALAAAVAWRFRDRAVVAGASVGVTLAAKFFIWPLVVWLAATRRIRAALAGAAIGIVLLVASWAVIGFDGLREYPDLLRRLEDTIGLDSYTARIVLLDVGAPGVVARVLWLALGLLVLAGVVGAARLGYERSGFILALAAALALTPIVWLHYFALLLVVVAVAQPTLSILWFVPLGMVVTPGSGHPAPWQTAWTLAIAAATVAYALRMAQRDERESRPQAAPVLG
jgi:glycosyl transferase family 87